MSMSEKEGKKLLYEYLKQDCTDKNNAIRILLKYLDHYYLDEVVQDLFPILKVNQKEQEENDES